MMAERLIDANALIEEFEYYIREAGWNVDWNRCLKDVAIECIKNAPTIEAEPVKHGKWIDAETECGYVCSVCGTSCLYELDLGMVFYRKSTYCPNCGARNDGE